MDDLISRQAAVSGISDLLILELKGERLPTYNEVYRAIYDLPSAQPVEDIHREKEQAYYCGYEDGAKAARSAQPGWIPCSESPMKNNSYLVWMPFAPEGHHITVAEWCGSYWNIKTPITAWMPLPKPWEGDANDT